MKKKETKEKKATPPRFSPEITRAFCEQIANGAGGRKAAEAVGVSRTSIFRWLAQSKEFNAAYAEACAKRIAALEEKVFELMDEVEALHEADLPHHQARLRLDALKLEIDTYKWQLCKLIPRKYGDKSQMEITGKDGAALLPEHTPEQDAAFAALIAAAQAKTAKQ